MLRYNDGYVFCTNCNLYRIPLGIFTKALIWAEGKMWWWRLLIAGWFGFVLLQNLQNDQFAMVRTNNFFSYFDLGMHELGHMVFMLMGEFLTIAGGSIFQCLVPILWMIGFIQNKWYFAASMCWCWLGINLFDVATYAADARARLLPLVTVGGIGDTSDESYDRAHDWYQLLSRTNKLDADLVIARGLRVAAVVCFLIGFYFGIRLIWRMFVSADQPKMT